MLAVEAAIARPASGSLPAPPSRLSVWRICWLLFVVVVGAAAVVAVELVVGQGHSLQEELEGEPLAGGRPRATFVVVSLATEDSMAAPNELLALVRPSRVRTRHQQRPTSPVRPAGGPRATCSPPSTTLHTARPLASSATSVSRAAGPGGSAGGPTGSGSLSQQKAQQSSCWLAAEQSASEEQADSSLADSSAGSRSEPDEPNRWWPARPFVTMVVCC